TGPAGGPPRLWEGLAGVRRCLPRLGASLGAATTMPGARDAGPRSQGSSPRYAAPRQASSSWGWMGVEASPSSVPGRRQALNVEALTWQKAEEAIRLGWQTNPAYFRAASKPAILANDRPPMARAHQFRHSMGAHKLTLTSTLDTAETFAFSQGTDGPG